MWWYGCGSGRFGCVLCFPAVAGGSVLWQCGRGQLWGVWRHQRVCSCRPGHHVCYQHVDYKCVTGIFVRACLMCVCVWLVCVSVAGKGCPHSHAWCTLVGKCVCSIVIDCLCPFLAVLSVILGAALSVDPSLITNITVSAGNSQVSVGEGRYAVLSSVCRFLCWDGPA